MSLDPHHLLDLQKSGLTDETIAAALIESIRPCDITRLIGFESADIESAYRIPFNREFERFKLFYSCTPVTGRKRPKYIQKKDSMNCLYFPPILQESELQSLSTIYFTEGEKKALKATQDGLPCVGITGLWNWKRKGSDDLLPDFDRINLIGREVVIVPDSDWQTPGRDGKPKNLKDAVYRLATALMLRGAVVKIAYLPSDSDAKVGLDDYLLEHTIAELAELRHENVSPRPCYRNESGNLNYYGVTADGFAPAVRISSAIEVMAHTRNDRNESWGKMLRFRDSDGVDHFYAMPMEHLSSDGGELRSKLYTKGLSYISVDRRHRPLLLQYLQTARPDEGRRARCVDRTGWHNEKLFVLPVGRVGDYGDEPVVYQGRTEPIVSQKGTVQGWIDNIGRYCVGNTPP